MNVDAAYKCVAILVTRTMGPWDDAIISAYVDEFVELENPVALADVCSRLARSWNEPYRVTLGAIMDGYRNEVYRLMNSSSRPATANGSCRSPRASRSPARRTSTNGNGRATRTPT